MNKLTSSGGHFKLTAPGGQFLLPTLAIIFGAVSWIEANFFRRSGQPGSEHMAVVLQPYLACLLRARVATSSETGSLAPSIPEL